MPARLRLGLFPFLNTQPLAAGLADDSEIELVIDVPSRIADRFRAGELDLALVPSFEAATLDAPILESICIASDGAVETVILHHRVELNEVRSLAVDEASRTSAALSKILIAQASGSLPKTLPFRPNSGEAPSADAVLVIGDPAFTFKQAGYRALDLGLAWKQQQSLPFVFAVMVAKSASQEISERIRRANLRGLETAATIARSYNSGVDAVRAEHYLRRTIRYDLGPREKEGLTRFRLLALTYGLLPSAKEFQFHAL